MFLREHQGLELAGSGGGRSFGRAAAFAPAVAPRFDPSFGGHVGDRLATIDWIPDLGARVGSATWWRGAATCLLLIGGTVALSPGLGRPIAGWTPAPLDGAAWEESRAQSIAPLALGAATGRRMAANDLVRPLAETPERPIVELVATLGDGDRFESMLQRAGVGRQDAARVGGLVAQAVALDQIRPGTRVSLTLGRRADKRYARPLEHLALRARFDLNVSVDRAGNDLSLTRRPIAIDRTPLRIQGLVGASLYRSARAAGAPAKVVEAYIKALATRLSIGRDVASADGFDIVAEQERAATGEVRVGTLQFAGLDQGRRNVQLVRWDGDGVNGWLDADGTFERRGFFGMPVNGRVTSSFGRRMHPVLGFLRMHKGIDIGAPHGTPIHAAIDGVVQFAGRNRGYGLFVKLGHSGGLASGYGHMSRIAVSPGTRVARGQVIGYVGSTGMSTGPHLHWEVWRGGLAINPRSISMSSVATLAGPTLRAFRAKRDALLGVRVGSAR